MPRPGPPTGANLRLEINHQPRNGRDVLEYVLEIEMQFSSVAEGERVVAELLSYPLRRRERAAGVAVGPALANPPLGDVELGRRPTWPEVRWSSGRSALILGGAWPSAQAGPAAGRVARRIASRAASASPSDNSGYFNCSRSCSRARFCSRFRWHGLPTDKTREDGIPGRSSQRTDASQAVALMQNPPEEARV